MALGQGKLRCGRSIPERWPLGLVLLALVLGPGLGGLAAWFHAHGPSGAHLHLLAVQHRHGDHDAVQAWHATQHRHDHGTGAPEEEQPAPPAPPGLSIEFPVLLAAAPKGPATARGSLERPALLPGPRWHVAPAERTHRPDVCHFGWPPQRARRTGIAALVRPSHAILI